MRGGYPTTKPIQTKQEAIDAINALFEMAGYTEGQGNLWLGHTLDRLKEFLGDPDPFRRHRGVTEAYVAPFSSPDYKYPPRAILAVNVSPDEYIQDFRQLADGLKAAGFNAEMEGMGGGITCVLMHYEGFWVIGTSDENWAADYYQTVKAFEDGEEATHIDFGVRSEWPAKREDVDAVLAAIVRMMQKPVLDLAKAFGLELRKELPTSQFREVIKRNACEMNNSICHSHDFCDANMVMADAFVKTFGETIDLHSDINIQLWNDAWFMAKTRRFSVL